MLVESIYSADNFTLAAAAKPVVGELLEQFVVYAETDPVEIQRINMARERAATTQALLTVLDNFWIETKQYPVEKERSNKLFDFVKKTPAELAAVIDDEYAKQGKRPSLVLAATGRWSVNTGAGFADTNPAVPNYGTIFGKIYDEPALMQGVLRLQFAARIVNMFSDPSAKYSSVFTGRDPEGSPVRIAGDALNTLIAFRAKDIAAAKDDSNATPTFPSEEFDAYRAIALSVLEDGLAMLKTKYPAKATELRARMEQAFEVPALRGGGSRIPRQLNQPVI